MPRRTLLQAHVTAAWFSLRRCSDRFQLPQRATVTNVTAQPLSAQALEDRTVFFALQPRATGNCRTHPQVSTISLYRVQLRAMATYTASRCDPLVFEVDKSRQNCKHQCKRKHIFHSTLSRKTASTNPTGQLQAHRIQQVTTQTTGDTL